MKSALLQCCLKFSGGFRPASVNCYFVVDSLFFRVYLRLPHSVKWCSSPIGWRLLGQTDTVESSRLIRCTKLPQRLKTIFVCSPKRVQHYVIGKKYSRGKISIETFRKLCCCHDRLFVWKTNRKTYGTDKITFIKYKERRRQTRWGIWYTNGICKT